MNNHATRLGLAGIDRNILEEQLRAQIHLSLLVWPPRGRVASQALAHSCR
jgi:hypothetical protein